MAGPIRIAVLGDVKDLVSGLDTGTSRLTKLGSVAKGIGRTVATGLLVAGAAATALGVASVKSASDAQQSIGATSTIFGKYARTVMADSRQAANAYGLSANEFRESSNLIGALFKNQGVESRKLAGETRTMIGVGSDLAATFGGTTAEAVGALGSAFKGEFDTLERYGISLKASTITAELAARGQDKLTGAALKAATQQVTTALIMKQAGGATGAFARESDTLANIQQKNAAQAENLKAKIGTALLPAMVTIGKVINRDVLPPLMRLANDQGPKLAKTISDLAVAGGPKLASFLRDLPTSLKNLSGSLKGLSGGSASSDLAGITDSLREVGPALKEGAGALPSFTDLLSVTSTVLAFAADNTDLLAKAMPVLAAGYLAVKAGQLAANAAAVLSVPTKIAEVVVNRQLVASNRELIATRAGLTGATITGTAAENVGILTRARGVVGMVASKVALVAVSAATKAAAAGQWLLNAAMVANPIGLVVVAIAALVGGFILAYKKSETFRNIVDGAMKGVRAVVSSVVGWFGNYVPKIFSAVVGAVRGYISTYTSVVVGGFNLVKGAISLVGSAFTGAVSQVGEFVSGTRTKVGEVVTFVKGIPGKITAGLGNLGGLLKNAGVQIIQGLLDGIESMVGKVTGKLKSLTDKIPNWKGPAQRDGRLLRPAGRLIIKGLIDGLEDGIPGVTKVLEQLTDDIAKAYKKKTGKELTKKQRSSLLNALEDERKALAAVATRYKRVSAALGEARAKLADMRKERADLYASVRGNALSFADITGVGELEDGTKNAFSIVKGLKDRLAAIRDFRNKIAALTRAKLNRTSLEQIIAQGVEAGGATASALVAGGAGAIGAVNQIQRDINTAATGLGADTAATFYDAGIAAQVGIVRGLTSDAAKLEAAAQRIARRIAATIKRELRLQLTDIYPGTRGGRGGGRSRTVAERPRVSADALARKQNAAAQRFTIELTAEQLNQIERGRRVTADIKAYVGAGGDGP